eukprot:6528749-Pyramimonas_sp.AAC.1
MIRAADDKWACQGWPIRRGLDDTGQYRGLHLEAGHRPIGGAHANERPVEGHAKDIPRPLQHPLVGHAPPLAGQHIQLRGATHQGYILTADQSDAGSVGIFSQRTNRCEACRNNYPTNEPRPAGNAHAAAWGHTTRG